MVEGAGKGRSERRLTARGVAAAKDGRHADGGGLYLEVSGPRRSWIWRYRIGDKRRDMGLGSVGRVTIAEVRAERDRWRDVLKTGKDPIEERERQLKAAGAATSTVPTFGEVADDYIDTHAPGWRSAKHAAQWRMTLTNYAAPLRALPVDQVGTVEILAVLKPHWQSRPETASRLRGRIELVLDAARALKHIDEGRANPARWRGHLDKLLAKRSDLLRGHHAAMPFKDVPAFVAQLRNSESVAARALEFVILTAVRTGEATGARWDEFDFEEKVWAIAAPRMKAGREHRVPLTDRAIELVQKMHELRRGDYVFPGTKPKSHLSRRALNNASSSAGLVVTIHGFRSSFRDWAGEATAFPREIAEAALAHVVGDKTERAYRRGDALERRRALMDAWAAFLDAIPADNVLKFGTLRDR